MLSQRRTTLGPVSSGALNSRNSFGPARIPSSTVKKNDNSASNTKLSMGSNRLSTNSGNNFGTSKLTADPRQISDKVCMNNSIKKVIKYVTEKGYNQAISTKILTNPTSKDFYNILEFLCRRYDPNFSWTKKAEEEVPLLFKRLRYPFPINKSALYSVGSPHTWPGLLAALTWLVDLLMYEELSNENQKSLQEEFESDESNHNKLFFEYLARSYELYMNGRDDDDTALWKDLDTNYTAKTQAIQNNVDLLAKANENMRQELQKAASQPSALVELENKKKVLQNDVEKFRLLISNLQNIIQAYQKKIAECHQEAYAKEQDLATVYQEKVQLKEILDKQEISTADVQRMQKDKANLQESLTTCTQRRAEIEKTLWDIEIAITKKLEDVEKCGKNYNITAQRLQLIPRSAKNAESIDFELSIITNAKQAEKMLNLDLKGSVKPALKKLKQEYIEKQFKAQEEYLSLTMYLQQNEEALIEKANEITQLEAHLKKLEAQCKIERDLLFGLLKQNEDECVGIEQDIQKLKSSDTSSLIQSQKTFEVVTKEFQELQVKFSIEKENISKSVIEIMSMFTQQKARFNSRLIELQQMYTEVQKDMLQNK